MTDEASFLAAIAAAPNDETLPMVFADWLDEQNDPRGQWLRHYAVRQWMGKDFQNPIPAILEAIRKDKQLYDARSAVEVIGEPIVPGLVELLTHEKQRVRQQACACLKRVGPKAKAAVPELLKLLSDPDTYVREAAAKAVQTIGADKDTDTKQLKAALTDENWNVREAASKVLGKMGAKGSVLEELAERFESPDVKDRLEVIEGLTQLGTAEVIPHLDKAIDDPKKEVRLAAVEALGRLRSDAVVAPLCRALKSRDKAVREKAAEQFCSCFYEGLHSADTVAALVEALEDKVANVRMWACCGLNRAGKAAASAAPAILKCLKDEDASVRGMAAESIGTIAHDDDTALAALMPLLNDHVNTVAGRAANALCQWKTLPDSVVDPLQKYVARARKSDSWEIQASAGVTALSKVPKPPTALIADLRKIVRDRNHSDWWSAVNALRELGPAAAPAIPDLVALLSGDSGHGEALNALLSIGGSALDELAKIIDGPDDGPKWKMLAYFWQAPTAGALLPSLLRLLKKTKDGWKVGQVMRAITALGPTATDAIPVFLEILKKHATTQHGSDAFHALCAFKSGLIPYLPQLEKLAVQERFAAWKHVWTKLFADLAPEAPQVLDVLRELLRSAAPVEKKDYDWNKHYGYAGARKEALRGFSALKAVEAIPDVVPLVADPDVDIRRHAVRFLGEVRTAAAAPPLRTALTDADESVRAAAAEELGSVKDTSEKTLAALVLAVEDRAPRVRRAAVESLGKLKTSTEAVLAALEAAAEDDDAKVVERAAIALKKLTPKEGKGTPAKAQEKPKTKKSEPKLAGPKAKAKKKGK